ncbi:MAG: hypothetical protein JXQ69_09365 [Paludibacteraceae bacterium]|nr:hypothetical protein [Paludibacteraceae bacterium]MBN2788514.1 hypothetical protein [Paludibacteraceae bacterium]
MNKLKNGYINNLAVSIIGTLLFSSTCFANNPYKEKKSSEIIVTAADSVVRIHVPVKVKNTKINNKSVYFWYASNHIYSNKGAYSGKLLDGEYRVFGKDGNLITYGNFDKGRKTGTWKYWDNAGTLIKLEPWKKGQLDGWKCEYNAIGKLSTKSRYNDGLKHGKETVYLTDTVLINKYKNGELVPPKVKAKKVKKEKVEPKTEKPKKIKKKADKTTKKDTTPKKKVKKEKKEPKKKKLQPNTTKKK